MDAPTVSPELTDKIKAAAIDYAESHMAFPTEHQRLFIENAMLVGCSLGLQFALDLKPKAVAEALDE